MRTTLTDTVGIDVPIVQAPMAGHSGVDLAVAVATSGALGSLPCAPSSPEAVIDAARAFRAQTQAPLHLNFFADPDPPDEPALSLAWIERLRPYFDELGVEPPSELPRLSLSFDEARCAAVEEARPEVVSFHFGLPPEALLARVLGTGARVMSSATTVAEAVWLAERGCAAVIAQGCEAGGHRGMFLSTDVASQVGTMALVPQVVDVVDVPVIAAGGIGDGRGIAAALALGAAGAQLGTAFLRCPEALTTATHRTALERAGDDATVVTNVLTGRPARTIANRLVTEVGPVAADVPSFPLAAAVSGPLSAAEASGSGDFSPLWCGQSAALGRQLPAAELVAALVDETRRCLEAAAALASA